MAAEPLCLSGIDTAPLEPATVEFLLEGFLGLDAAPSYDAELVADAAAAAVTRLLETSFPRARLVRGALRAARSIREMNHVPHDLGYRREAVRLATKIFDALSGRTLRGRDVLADALVVRGAVRTAEPRVDIVVAAEPGDAPIECGLAFELGVACTRARYRFTAADLDAAAQREMRRLYPRSLPADVRDAARDVCRDVLSSPVPDPAELRTLALSIQEGIRAKYADHAPSEDLFLGIIEKKLLGGGRDDEELKLLKDFLEEVRETRLRGSTRDQGKSRRGDAGRTPL